MRNPINKIDPSGHSPTTVAWICLGFSVLGLIFTSIGIGLAISAAGGIMAGLSAFGTTAILTAGITALAYTIGIVSAFGDIFEWGGGACSATLKFFSIALGAFGLMSGSFFR